MTILRIILILILAYLLIALAIYSMRRSIIFKPQRNLQSPAEYNLLNFRSVTLKTKDDVRLTAWHHLPKENYPTILYFHGNAGHMGDRAARLEMLANAGFGILALSYRGYGTSEGNPSEEGLYLDGRQAVDFLLKENKIEVENIILFGESLGSGVSTQLASEMEEKSLRFGMIILEAPFTSVSKLGQEIYPFLPVKLLIGEKFNSLEKIRKIYSPILIIHSKHDPITPVRHGEEVFEAANEPKDSEFLESNEHIDINSKHIIDIILKYVKKHELI